jgi:hypothetical protein
VILSCPVEDSRVQTVCSGDFTMLSLEPADSTDVSAYSDLILVSNSWKAVSTLRVNESDELFVETSSGIVSEPDISGISVEIPLEESIVFEAAGTVRIPTIIDATITELAISVIFQNFLELIYKSS